jgi:hypothetical protein
MELAQANQYTLDDHPILDDFRVKIGSPGVRVQVRIRRYQESDREAVRLICCETGFLGQPIDRIYRDRELFADLICNPYLDYEPEWTLVAEADGRLVGYLLGSVSPHFQRNRMLSGFKTSCRMLARHLTGRYAHHPRSEQFVRWVLSRGLKEQPNHPEGAAHLHFNLERVYRIGTVTLRLWSVFQEMLQAAGVDHVYGEFFSCDQRNPERIYQRYGFKIYDRSETTIFQPEIPNLVSIVCSHKWLNRAVYRMPVPVQTSDSYHLHI